MNDVDSRSAEEAAAPPEAPDVRLYSPVAIGVHAFLFTPLLGAVMAALNYGRLGQRDKATKTLLIGLGATVLLFALGVLIPESWGSALNGAFAGGAGALALAFHREQKPIVEAHRRAGGQLAPWWPATIVGASFVAVVLALVLGPLLSPVDVAFTRGVDAFQAGRYEEAEAQFRAAVHDDPDNDTALYDLGLTLARRGKLDEALETLRRVRDDSEVGPEARTLRSELEGASPRAH